MDKNEILSKLNNSKIEVLEEKEISNGKQLVLSNGAKINIFKNGNFNVQGKNSKETESLLKSTKLVNNKKIFVVYGHDEIAKIQLEALLRRWELEPIILDQQVSQGQTIIEKLEECSSDVNYAIVLATPDDEGKALEDEHYKKRVRQNVVLELGMFLAKLGRDKVAILLKEDRNFEKPSDIQGLIYIPYEKKIEEVTVSLVKELAKQGYNIDNTRL